MLVSQFCLIGTKEMRICPTGFDPDNILKRKELYFPLSVYIETNLCLFFDGNYHFSSCIVDICLHDLSY